MNMAISVTPSLLHAAVDGCYRHSHCCIIHVNQCDIISVIIDMTSLSGGIVVLLGWAGIIAAVMSVV